jgi:hypothetical protein
MSLQFNKRTSRRWEHNTKPAFGLPKDYDCGIREHNEELGLMHSIRSFNTAQGTPILVMGWRFAKADNESSRTFKQLVCDELAARNGQTARENDGGPVCTGCVVFTEGVEIVWKMPRHFPRERKRPREN